MTSIKRAPKFTEEERAVLKRIYKVRAQLEKEMEGMSLQEQLDFMNNVKKPTSRRRSKKGVKSAVT